MSEEFKWVSCSRDSDWNTSLHRHLAGKADQWEFVTTFCGATGSPGAFRGNSTKPECPRCLASTAYMRLSKEVDDDY